MAILPELETARLTLRRLDFEDAPFVVRLLNEPSFLQNIGDRGVLLRLAAACGLDGVEVDAALDDGRYRSRISASIETARQAGITGTPTFIFDDRFALVGAQS